MVMEGQIDEHIPMPELEEAREAAMKQVTIFQEAAAKVEERDFESALELIEDSEMPEETRTRLVGALETGEWDLIDSVFSDYKSRLGQAFCEERWGSDGT
jgi:hypothetical protein